MNKANVLRFVLLGLIWGASYTFIKVSLDGLSESQLVLARLLLGALVLLVVIKVAKVRLPSPGSAWGHIAVTAVLGMVLPFLLLAWGEQHTSAAMAGVLIGATPLLTLGAAAFFLPTEKVTWRKTGGLLLGFAGVVLVISPWQSAAGSLKGQVAVIGAAACYAAQTVYVRRFLAQRGLAPLAASASQIIAALFLQAAVTPAFAWETPSVSWSVGLSILVLGTVGTGLAYLLYFRLIADVGATTASAVNYLVPVTAVAIGATILGEAVTWNMVVGTVVVLAALAFAENRITLRRRASAAAGASQPTARAREAV
ncbi:DMT family transporter [Streptomyces sp. NPDC127084]|uniref:DMT family transporter n=1 Tax=Streptomyces sp. NPDC127084 TaxID=3347133 RepID=UPI00364C5388